MAQRRALPKICIALGLPDVPRLLEQARREADAGENFLEFRIDYLPDPALGAEAVAAAEHLDATLCVWDGDDGPGTRAAARAAGVDYRTVVL